jgi:hypothetical protein
MFPLVAAWPLAARGEIEAARAALGDFSVLDVVVSGRYDLEAHAVAAVVFAAVGSVEQRRWAYERLLPYAGLHVVVGGCASYHAAVDHHLGSLATALGEVEAAAAHFRDAHAMHERLGAAGWARISAQALADLDAATVARNDFRLAEGRWHITYAGQQVHLPDAKGLRDLWAILSAQGSSVHVLTLLNPPAASYFAGLRSDPVLDERAKAEYRAQLDRLSQEIDDANELGQRERADRLRAERDALIHELAAASGLGGRTRRLGDTTERARKTVSARLRDALTKIDDAHPRLGAHLRSSVRMGTTCSYNPDEPTPWRLR